ncbi:MAG: DUF4910 domain-containing protein [Candidatus Heimdallarchaeota archaeon]|nr:DUF4910 domain-containing protein [Candidatus Heimdallarchaeota archaeon]
MEIKPLIDVLLKELSGKRAKDWVAKISSFHRIQGSPMYKQISAVLADDLMQSGMDVKRYSYPADGKTKFWCWETPYSWSISSGSLRMIEPKNEIVMDFDEIPTAVITHSRSCDIVAELVDIDRGRKEDFENKDLDGKIVLMTGSVRGDFSLWMKESGAIACIIYPGVERAGKHPEMVRYDGFWPSSKTFDAVQSGISISYTKAIELKALLCQGAVRLHMKIEAELYEGELEVLTTVIKGDTVPHEEILLMAHLCHPAPSANDNASGAAGLFELAKTLHRLVKSKTITLDRSIRFLWMPEFHGTVPFAHQFESQWKNTIAAINLDMIGESPVTIGYPFNVNCSSYSTPSFLNDLIKYITIYVADHKDGLAVNGSTKPMNYRFLPFDGGSDHIISNDHVFSIPSVMFGHNDDFHHTNLDITDNVDSTELQRIMGITASTAVSMAITSFSSEMAGIISAGIMNRRAKTMFLLHSPKDQIPAHLIHSMYNYEMKLLDSLPRQFSENNQLVKFITIATREMESWKDFYLEIYGSFNDNGKTYRRNFEGPMSFSLEGLENIFSHESYRNISFITGQYGGFIFELMNLIGKEKTPREMTSILSIEYGKPINHEDICSILNLLEENKIITVS